METGLGKFYLTGMSKEDILKVLPIELVARSLSRECRYMGLPEHFYSVAQHSVIVSHMVPERLALEGLLHDVAEVITRDQPTPWKKHINSFVARSIVCRLENSLMDAYGVTDFSPLDVKIADTILYQIERDALLMNRDCLQVNNIKYDLIQSPKIAEELFLKRYYDLTRRT